MLDPMKVGRAVVATLVVGYCHSAFGQDIPPPSTQRLTEADVIRLSVLAEPRLREAASRVALAEADAFAATLLKNPMLQWEREALPGSGANAGSQDALSLSLPLDLSGRRAARGAMARSAAELARADVQLARSDAAARALRVYYAALGARERGAIAGRAVQRLDEAARVLAARHREGSVSGYDRLRLDIEVELSRSRALQAGADERSATGTLGVLLGIDTTSLQLEGHLTPDAAVAAEAVADSRPSHERMAVAMSALAEADDAASSAWVPRVTLRGGMQVASADETQLGYIAGIAVELPFLSHGQGLSRAVGARRAAVRERMAVDTQSARVDARGAALRLASARQELTRLQAALAPRLDQLDGGALASYREGVRGLTELLDAQRTRTEVELRLLELRLHAKHAEVALRAARGELQ